MAIVALQDAKDHLNITGTTQDDAEVVAFLERAEATIAEWVGPLAPTATTVRVTPAGGRRLRLPVTPAISLTSVTDSSSVAVTVADLYLDGPRAGVVTYNSGAAFTARYYTVVYQSGRATLPADLKLAILELLRHMWTTQRGPQGRPGSRESEAVANTIPGAAYTLPIRVSQLIGPHIPAMVG